jgi:hypothetical protein
LGILGKLANLARGWAPGTTGRSGRAPRSLSCDAYIRRVPEIQLLRTSHAYMYESKGSETWYELAWLHASARAYAHMPYVWVCAAASTFIKRSRIWLFSRSRSGDIVEAACGRRSLLGRRKHPIAERL